MVMAISAFVLQGAMISVSQAKAAAGAMPQPAITLSGSVHLHDKLAGQVYDHGGNNAEGHVHDGPNTDKDGGASLSWNVFALSIAVPAFIALVRPLDLPRRLESAGGSGSRRRRAQRPHQTTKYLQHRVARAAIRPQPISRV